MDLRVSGTLTRHILRFDIPLPASTESDLRNPDKEQLRADILAMLQRGKSYRQIGAQLGIHWTRVGQIVKQDQVLSDKKQWFAKITFIDVPETLYMNLAIRMPWNSLSVYDLTDEGGANTELEYLGEATDRLVAGDTDLTDQDDDTPTTKPMLGDEIEGIHMFLNTCCYELERKTTSLQIAISQIPPAWNHEEVIKEYYRHENPGNWPPKTANTKLIEHISTNLWVRPPFVMQRNVFFNKLSPFLKQVMFYAANRAF